MQAERRISREEEPQEQILTGPKKVAALLLAMDKKVASRLLKHFDDDDIKLIALIKCPCAHYDNAGPCTVRVVDARVADAANTLLGDFTAGGDQFIDGQRTRCAKCRLC